VGEPLKRRRSALLFCEGILRLVSAFAVVLGLAACACAQTQGAKISKSSWQVFAPAGLGFSIEVPSKPARIKNEYGDIDPKGYKSIYVYGPRQTSRRTSAFKIIVLIPSDAMSQENGGINKLGGLEFTIGGDDAEPTSRSSITVNGFKGKEFIYHFSEAEEFGHRIGRVIDAKTRIFVLIYATNTAVSLQSSAAARFFNSFKLM
jgi:hypothetical protein